MPMRDDYLVIRPDEAVECISEAVRGDHRSDKGGDTCWDLDRLPERYLHPRESCLEPQNEPNGRLKQSPLVLLI